MFKSQDNLKRIQDLSSFWNLEGQRWNLPDLMISQLYLALLLECKGVTGLAWIKKSISRVVFRITRISERQLPKTPVQFIFWPAEINHLDQMIPIAHALQRNGVSFLFIATKKKVQIALRNSKLPFFSLPHGHLKESIAIRQTLKTGIDKTGRLFKPQDLEVVDTLYESAPWVANLIAFTEYLIKNLEPNILMVGYDITLEGRIAARVSREHAVFTCAIQHGDMSAALNSEHVVHQFYVFGERVKEQLQIRNEDVEFIVTGAPYLEAQLKPTSLKIIPELLSLPAGDYILVAFSGPGNNTSHAHHKALIHSIYQLATELPEINIVIKLHPKDEAFYYKEIAKNYNVKNVTLTAAIEGLPKSILDWLRGAKILITGGSTTAIEAMLLQVPVISIDLQGEYDALDFVQKNACVRVQKEEELPKTVFMLLDDPHSFSIEKKSMAEYVNSYYYTPAQGAAAYCAEIILKTVTLSVKK